MSSLRSLLLNTQTGGYQGELDFAGLEAMDSNGAVLVAEQRWTELSELSLNISHLNHIHDGLEEIKESVVASLHEGGLDRSGAAIIVSSTKALMLPLEHTLPLPSLERFGGRGERIGSTHIAIESLKDKINKIWEAIKKAFERLRVKVMNWYRAIFDSVTKIQNRANKIIEEAKKIDKSPEKDSFDFVIERISSDGKSVDNLSKDMDVLNEMAGAVLSSLYNSMTTKASNSFTEAIKSLNVKSPESIVEGMEKFYQVVANFNKLLKGLPMKLNTTTALSENHEGNKSFQSTDEIEYFKGVDLPGNRAFYYGQPKEVAAPGLASIGLEETEQERKAREEEERKAREEQERKTKEEQERKAREEQERNQRRDGNDVSFQEDQKNRIAALAKYFGLVSKMGYKLSDADEDRDVDKDKVDVKTPTALTIESLAKKVLSIMDHVGKYKETSNKVSETKSALMKKGDDLSKKIAENKFLEAENSLFSLVGLSKDCANILDGPGDEIVSLCVSVSNVVLNYCQAALACYK